MALRKQPLYEQVYRELRREIAAGDLAPGVRLDIQEVAHRLEISRTPVREAIRQLIQEGLVEVDREGRASVFEPDLTELAEIYAVRAALESAAARIVANRRPVADLTSLRDAVSRSRQAEYAENWLEVARANTEFHESLVVLSKNLAMVRILDTFRIQVSRYRRIALEKSERRDRARCAHEGLLDLLESGDADGAGAQVYQEVMNAAAFAVGTYSPNAEGESPTEAYIRKYGG